MLDTKALRNLSYGLYIVSSQKDGNPVGCVVNTFAQVTSSPLKVSVALNKENYTTDAILETGSFEVVVLDESAPMDLIGTFGFHSSKEINKFESFAYTTSDEGLCYITQNINAHFSVKMLDKLDLGSHWYIVGEVQDAQVCGDVPSMTYLYYHAVKGGKTPPKASSYIPEEGPEPKPQSKYAWRCMVCGHIEYVDELPDDFVCPVCGVGKDMFERIEL